MRVLILGVGDAFTARHFGSSALIEAPGGFVLVDCPDLIHRALREGTSRAGWNVDAAKIDDIILTHLHGDHCNGLESFAFARALLRERHPDRPMPRLHTTMPVAQRLWERLAPAMDGGDTRERRRTLDDFYLLRVLEPETECAIAGLTVRCRFTGHPVPTIGLLVSDDWTLGWSGDTPFEPAHVQWLAQATVIVHESNLGPAHTPIQELNALPDRIRQRIRLIHLPDDFDTAATDMRPLKEGEVLDG